jgi:hypothetical protein
LGNGFTFSEDADDGQNSIEVMRKLVSDDPRNREVIQIYVGSEDVNSKPHHLGSRYVINFFDRPLKRTADLKSWRLMTPNEQSACMTRGIVPLDYAGEVAADWPDLLRIVERLVKPDRDGQNRKALRERWWQFADKRPGLYAKSAGLEYVCVTGSKAAMHHMIARIRAQQVFSDKLIVFPMSSFGALAALQSLPHELWSRTFGATFGSSDALTYNPTQVFATFPFPLNFEADPALILAGQAYHDHRARLMTARNEGLTKTYNRVHDRNEKSPDIIRLRELHDAMDRAVLTAYGWTELAERIASDPEAMARHLTEDTEDDHKYQGRFFWPAPIRDEVLARLLALNAERAEAERLAGITPVASDEDDGEYADEESGDEDEAA